MGFGGISIGSLILILLIGILLFGTKKFRNIGEDLGTALKGFKKGLSGSSSGSDTDKKPKK
ncbi:MAG: twin-arginine translocase subunit TatA [Legionellales bacterium]|nr:MAG: twin-arginine translocase subunit TatA [Legionellales bacterium]